MSTSINHYVEKVLRQIDGSKEEKEDLYEELACHLRMSREHWIQSGLSEDEASKKALDDFGNAEAIGSEIHEAMYPFRKILLIILATISLLYAYAVYIFSLFVDGDANMLWLLLSVGVSSLLLMIALQVFPTIDRKATVNFALIAHALIFLVGVGMNAFFSITALAIVTISVALIYRTTVVDYDFKETKYRKQLKICHIYNITIGLFIVGITLYLWVIFLMFADEFTVGMLVLFVPLLIWIVVYYSQIKLVKRGNVLVPFFMGMLPFAIVAFIIFFLFYDLIIMGVMG